MKLETGLQKGVEGLCSQLKRALYIVQADSEVSITVHPSMYVFNLSQKVCHSRKQHFSSPVYSNDVEKR